MPNTLDLKRRIKSVKSTQQITRAMQMVSATKLRRSQAAVYAVRPYAHRMEGVIRHLTESVIEHELMQPREHIAKVAYVLIGSDRGLCGGFNGNLHRFTEHLLRQETRPFELIVLGRRFADFCLRKGWTLSMEHVAIGDNPVFAHAKLLAERLRELYLTGVYDEVHIVYTEFKSAMSYVYQHKLFLPLVFADDAEDGVPDVLFTDYILEPCSAELLATIVPQYLYSSMYSMLQEAKASEHGARTTAMRAATDNATEMIDKLTLSLNRARQAAITTEITEIVSGAAALE